MSNKNPDQKETALPPSSASIDELKVAGQVLEILNAKTPVNGQEATAQNIIRMGILASLGR